MGLLDGNLLGGIDPTDPRLALAAGLLGGTGNFGANLGQGLLGAQKSAQAKQQFGLVQQNAERANRQNDLQQVTGLLQSMLKQDAMQAIQDDQNGVQHVQNPAIATLQAKANELAGLPALSAGAQSSSPSAAPAAQPSRPQPSPFQYGASPNLQPAQGVPAGPATQFQGVQPPPQSAQLPQGQPQGQQPGQPQLTPSQIALARLRRQGDMYDIAGFPQIAQNLYKRTAPTATRNGVYFEDPLRPGQMMVGGGMMQPGSLNIGIGPDGQPSAAPLPGQVQSAAQLAAAQAAGKGAGEFPFKTVDVQQAGGGTVPRLLSGVVGQPNLGSLASLFGQPQPQQGQQVPASVFAAAASGKPFEAAQTPDGQVSFNPNPGKPNPQDPFSDIPPRYTPQGVGQSTFDKAMSEKQAEAASTLASKLGTQADTANQRIALNNQAKELVDQSTTGPKAALINDVKNWLVSRVGIPEQTIVNAGMNSPSAATALQKDLLNAATQKAKAQFGSRITQSEVMLMLTRGAPNIDMTKAAIKYLIDSDNAVLGYQVKQADDFGTYLQKGGDPMRFEGWYSRKFPMTKDVSAVQMNIGSAPKTVRFEDLP